MAEHEQQLNSLEHELETAKVQAERGLENTNNARRGGGGGEQQ